MKIDVRGPVVFYATYGGMCTLLCSAVCSRYFLLHVGRKEGAVVVFERQVLKTLRLSGSNTYKFACLFVVFFNESMRGE